MGFNIFLVVGRKEKMEQASWRKKDYMYLGGKLILKLEIYIILSYIF